MSNPAPSHPAPSLPAAEGAVRLYLVRHGRAAAGYGSDRDPGLSDEGHTQAEAVVDALATIEPRPIRTSPLLRCRETAAPLARAWGVEPLVDPLIAEVASPTDDLDERAAWLRRAMAGTWADLEPTPVAWRQALVDHIRGFDHSAVMFTHFVVINAVIGAATGDDRVMVAGVGYTSVTVIDVVDGELHLVSTGEQAESMVL